MTTDLHRNQIKFALTLGFTTIVAIATAYFVDYYIPQQALTAGIIIYFVAFVIDSCMEREKLQNRIRELEGKKVQDAGSFLFKTFVGLGIAITLLLLFAEVPDKQVPEKNASLVLMLSGLLVTVFMYFLKWRTYCRDL